MRQEMLCTMPQRVKLEIANPSEVQGTITRSGSTINISSYLNKKSLLRGDIVKLTKSSNITYPTTYEGTTPKAWGCKVTIQNTTSEVNGEVSYTVPSPKDKNTLTASVTKVPGYYVLPLDYQGSITGTIEVTDSKGNKITSTTPIYLDQYVYFKWIPPAGNTDYGHAIPIYNTQGNSIQITGLGATGLKLALPTSGTSFIVGDMVSSSFAVNFNSNISLYSNYIGGPSIPSGSNLPPLDPNSLQLRVCPKQYTSSSITYKAAFIWIERTYTNITKAEKIDYPEHGCSNFYSDDVGTVLYLSIPDLTGIGNVIPIGNATIHCMWLDINCPKYSLTINSTSTSISSGGSKTITLLNSNNSNYSKIDSGAPWLVLCGKFNSYGFKKEIPLGSTVTLTSNCNGYFYKSGSTYYLKITNTGPAGMSLGKVYGLIFDNAYDSYSTA